MSSRLFVAIREKRGLAYQVSSFLSVRKESGLYGAYIGTKPESFQEAKTVLLEEVKRMSVEKATDDEISDTKSFLKGMNIMEQESNSGQASMYGRYEILGLGYEFVDTYKNGIENVTADDVIKTAEKYLTLPYSFGGVIAK
jgi:predicted Zn-dependent peptidase